MISSLIFCNYNRYFDNFQYSSQKEGLESNVKENVTKKNLKFSKKTVRILDVADIPV